MLPQLFIPVCQVFVRYFSCRVENLMQTKSNTQWTLTDKHYFNGLFSRTIWVSLHQKYETNLDFNEARDDGWH